MNDEEKEAAPGIGTTGEEGAATAEESAGVAETAAAEEAEPESLAQSVVGFIRERTKIEGKLLRMASLEVDGALLDSETLATLISEILADERNEDLKVLQTPAGVSYMYSEEHMSNSYARILLGVEHGNPYDQMANIVREESEIYPRPTTVSLFRDPSFGLDPEKVELLVDEMLRLEQYRDIKRMEASTGAAYLYSERHMGEEYARSLMEWQEVGAKANP